MIKKEIEVKILNIDRKKIRSKLKELGARVIHRAVILNEVYFDLPGKKHQFSSFRLRSRGKRAFLTIKFKKLDDHFNIADEYETEVSGFALMKNMLQLAGFTIFRERQKIREEYVCGRVKVEIDEYPGMKPYLEIEATNKKNIETFLKRLGYSLSDTTNETATAVIKRAGLSPNRLFFK